ncbi:MAG: hypothetical protein Q9216_006236 [Gyalolechia sp. 2 TL-2023]
MLMLKFSRASFLATSQAGSHETSGLDDDLGEFVIIDDLFKQRAKDQVQKPLIAFPASERGIIDFEYFTGQDLDRFVEHAARYYLQAGLRVNHNTRVAILGPTNIEWVATVFGLLRAGFAVVTLSPRISAKAVMKLMSETHCESIICADSSLVLRTVDQVKEQASIQTVPILRRTWFDRPSVGVAPLTPVINKAKEAKRLVIIQHSSGSTGLPKPIYATHERCTQSYPGATGTKEFMTLPLYHSFPMSILPWNMYKRRTTYFPNPHVPITRDSIYEALRVARPQVVHAVPYVLKLLAERPESVDVLKSCSEVITVGSRCPDELGDRLVDLGVNLCSWLGSTETGLVGTSANREPGDREWAYLRISEIRMKNIWPRCMGDDQYEFVFLKDYPSRVESNSDDPPDSFYSKDIYSRHPTIPNAWKYLGRFDDRVTLTNGEKVLPLPIEGRIREQPLVREAVVFGVAKSVPGLLVFRSEEAKEMPDEEFIDHIWPDVKDANLAAEGFSQIGKDMIVPLPADAKYPQTDKGSFIRPQVYLAYEKEISEVYDRLEQQQEGTLQLEVPELEEHIIRLGRGLLGEQLENKTSDFFSAGMDSLRAIQLRSLIIKDLDLGGNSKSLNQNIVFETSNVENLARHLYDLRKGHTSDIEDAKKLMERLTEKYSVFKKHSPGVTAFPGTYTVVLTGATGGLGSQLLSQLSYNHSVSRIFCLVRGSDPSSRVHDSLRNRNLNFLSSKIIALTSDLSDPTLGLDEATFAEIRSSATHIIHAAWPVNFQLTLSSFEPQIQGLHNLLQLSLSSPYSIPAKLLFCSSVAAALGTPVPAKIPEKTIENLDHASNMGYGQSKLVGEHIVAAAVQTASAQATILRIGQVVGDTKHGMWTDREAIPAIVRSALTMGILPELKILCQWLPVDTLAECVLEIGGLSQNDVIEGPEPMNGHTDDRINGEAAIDSTTNAEPCEAGAKNKSSDLTPMNLIYNLLSPHTFPWTSILLPALHATKLSFQPVPTTTWLERLRSLASSNSTTDPAADPDKNPALKLIQYYESAFLRDEQRDGRVEFEIEESLRRCRSLREVEDVVESGLMGKMVGWWMGRWEERKGEEGKFNEGEQNGRPDTEERSFVDGNGDGIECMKKPLEHINGIEHPAEEARAEHNQVGTAGGKGDGSAEKADFVNGGGQVVGAGDLLVGHLGLVEQRS